MVTVLANGMAGNAEITEDEANFEIFMKALNTLTVGLCRMIAADGEGATKLLECKVVGAKSKEIAKVVVSAVKEVVDLDEMEVEFKFKSK